MRVGTGAVRAPASPFIAMAAFRVLSVEATTPIDWVPLRFAPRRHPVDRRGRLHGEHAEGRHRDEGGGGGPPPPRGEAHDGPPA
ncbi:MAG: hypothetical protein ACKOK8_11195, partial [Planctomycetia bacterium]